MSISYSLGLTLYGDDLLLYKPIGSHLYKRHLSQRALDVVIMLKFGLVQRNDLIQVHFDNVQTSCVCYISPI